MRPNKRDGGADNQDAPDVITDTPNEVVYPHLNIRSTAPMPAMGKMLAMLGDLSQHMNRMEISQREQAGKKSNGSPKSTVLGVGAGINLQTWSVPILPRCPRTCRQRRTSGKVSESCECWRTTCEFSWNGLQHARGACACATQAGNVYGVSPVVIPVQV